MGLIKCLKAIRAHAFDVSDFPVVVTLEDHLTPELQSKVAEVASFFISLKKKSALIDDYINFEMCCSCCMIDGYSDIWGNPLYSSGWRIFEGVPIAKLFKKTDYHLNQTPERVQGRKR